MSYLSLSLHNTQVGLNYDVPQGESRLGTVYNKYVDEIAVRLDLDDLGGEIVSGS